MHNFMPENLDIIVCVLEKTHKIKLSEEEMEKCELSITIKLNSLFQTVSQRLPQASIIY